MCIEIEMKPQPTSQSANCQPTKKKNVVQFGDENEK